MSASEIAITKQYSHYLERAVRWVDELELSNVAPWDMFVVCCAAVASLHQTDGLCWEEKKNKRTDKNQLHVYSKACFNKSN